MSDVLVNQYEGKLEFPVESANNWGIDENDFYFALKFSGNVRLPENTQFAFIATGIKEGFLHFIDAEGVRTDIPVFEEEQAVQYDLLSLTSIDGLIRGEIIYKQKSNDWTLIPILVFPDGHFELAYKHDVLWQSDSIRDVPVLAITANRILMSIFDIGIIAFVLVWFVFAIKPYLKMARWPMAIGFFSLVVSRILSTRMLPEIRLDLSFFADNQWDLVLVEENYQAIWILFVGISLLAWAKRSSWREKATQLAAWKINLIAYAPLILGYYGIILIDGISEAQFLRKGNDYLTFQNFARQIFVYGDPLHIAAGTFRFQPLYRYFIGFLHLLFGQSTASQYLFNVWAYFGTGLAVAWIAESWANNSIIAIMGSITVLFMQIADRYYKFVLLTLTEHSASFFIILTAVSWILYKKRGKPQFAFLAALFGTIGSLIRLEHVILIAAMSLFAIEPLYGNLKEVWKSIRVGFVKNWKVFDIILEHWR